jgi:hypothetical protein
MRRRALLCFVLLGLGRPALGGEQAPSPVIYPAPPPVLRFSHIKHSATPCARCHAGVTASSSASDQYLPLESACAPCHPQTRGGKRGQPAGCAFCHPGFDGKGSPPAFLYPVARLRFGHRLHLEKGSACRDCHRFERPGDRGLPMMASCLGCHKQRRASVRCVVCHLSEKDGRLTTRFGAERLQPSGSLRGDRHGPLFSRKHAAVARLNRSYCESCHQPRACLRCHAGTLRPMRIHPNDYASLHSLDGRRDQTRCRSCHSLQTFCVGCHQRSGVGMESERSGFRPERSRSFHPPGFSTLQRGAGHHAYSARRNGGSCLSCHREATCVRCHGSRGRGLGGFSPHPPGFAASGKCRALAARNPRACLKCHLPGEARGCY